MSQDKLKKNQMNNLRLFLFALVLLCCQTVSAQPLYFPPISSTETWETTDPASLSWCPEKINELYDFLEQENTKGFIILKDGKIVLERYFGTFTNQNLWYWASAGKTITAFLIGKAQEENLLSINDRTSQYLGEGWTNCSIEQENNITIRNQLTMTSGLDDGVPDSNCTTNTCLNYLADAGTRWAYHNAPYTLLEGVLENATGLPINTYTQQKLKNLTGMNGSWVTVDFNNVFFSSVRSMARFGLLIQGNGVWDGNQLINSNYFNEMVNTSQSLNKSYGYLWWLNGKPSYMLPTTQFVFPGSYAPDAPADMISGLGRDGQIVSISQSRGLVFVRMGEAPNSASSDIATVLCNQIWQKIDELVCNLAVATPEKGSIVISPNPALNHITISTERSEDFHVDVFDLVGNSVLKVYNERDIDISQLSAGVYIISFEQGDTRITQKLIKK